MSTDKVKTPVNQPARGGAAEAVGLRFEFYRDRFRTLVAAVPVLGIALLVSLAMNVVLLNRQPERFFFTVDSAGRVIPIRPLSEPYLTDANITAWVADKVIRAYAMDPKNYRQQISDMSGDFTPDGYQSYVRSLESSGILSFLVENLVVSSAIPTGVPLIVAQGTLPDGTYHWRVRVPVLVDYRSATKQSSVKRVVEVVVVRRHTIEAPLGIGIAQFVATEAR